MEIIIENIKKCITSLSNLVESIDWLEHEEKFNSLYMNHSKEINENVKDWPLMDSIDTTACISAIYLVLVLSLNFFMKFFKDVKLKFVVLCYNLFMMGLNFYVFSAILVTKYKAQDFGLCSKIHKNNDQFFEKFKI
ncbi:elongation of very long chain fatty acids 4 [Brachionus plicatilis]|uniref:Elongation of very long chain fatty acids 4 n=1 Tax=Brachionus plicatilis TaxID=10195 RepID=A0A3M7PVD2_BRAPC|nr:elongation of very long chain fatty acids 4 [Brachionus plicatilis]